MNIVFNEAVNFIKNLDSYAQVFLSNLGIYGALLSCLLIVVESILPVLPLCVFITLLFYTFGNLLGLLISWIFTCIGCYLSFSLVRGKLKGLIDKHTKTKTKNKINSFMKYVDNMSLSSLAILVAIPFTPAFAVNIACGFSKISVKKFMTAMLIGKIFMVYFWGYIGTTLIECLTHPIYIVKILVLLLITFIISKMSNKILKLD